MSVFSGPKVESDNCIMMYDAYSSTCNPSSGVYTNPYSAISLSAAGSPVRGGGSLTMNGTTDYLAASSVVTGPVRTVNIVYQILNLSTGRGPLWRVDDWRERIFPGSITLIASSGTYYDLGGPSNNTSIVNVCYSYNGANARSYLNGRIISNITMDSSMNSGTYSYRFGNQSGGSTNLYINMKLFYVAFYNIQLSDEQVFKNFNSLRTRFEIN